MQLEQRARDGLWAMLIGAKSRKTKLINLKRWLIICERWGDGEGGQEGYLNTQASEIHHLHHLIKIGEW